METLKRVADLRRAVSSWRARSETIGLVPTMGALHAGHMALVARARATCARVVVSIFVNPTQFGPGEDLATYPRDEAGDLEKLAGAGVDVVFAPGVAEMYPEGFATSVRVKGMTEGLCGAFRPVHFEGVATIVTKLLLQVSPDVAFFGEKDYQQLRMIERLARDLDIPVRIAGVATVREADGLALSSRNQYLSESERRVAPLLYRTLCSVADKLAAKNAGAAEIAAVAELAKAELLAAGFAKVDYFEVRDAQTLAPIATLARPARLLAAVRLGKTRLIDNVPLSF
jgi:pantoate--beta-alanine ligase